jgi:hypothetical protein
MLTTQQKGNLVESLVANLITIQSAGAISASIPIVDDFGVDVVLTRKVGFRTLYLQVKSRFEPNSKHKGRFDFNIQKSTFSSSRRLFVLLVYYKQKSNEIDTMWFIPSSAVKAGAVQLKKYYRVITHLTPASTSRWEKYRTSFPALIGTIRKRMF